MDRLHFFYRITTLLLIELIVSCITLTAVAQQSNSDQNAVDEECQRLISSDLEVLESSLITQLRSCYVNQGYFDVKILTGDTLLVDKGERYSYGAFAISPDSLTLPTIQLEGDYYNSLKLQSVIEEWVHLKNDQGYLFAAAEIKDVYLNRSSLTVDLSIELKTGKRVYSGKVLFKGAELNDPKYLKKVSGAIDSVLVTPDYLNHLQTMLRQSGMLDEVREPELIVNQNGEVNIMIGVRESQLNQFDGILGYVPDPSGNGQLVGELDLSLWNALAQGNGIRFNFERLRLENTRLYGQVRQHWIGNLPVGLEASGQFFQNDSSYQYRQLNLGGYYLAGNGLRLNGRIGTAVSVEGQNRIRNIEPDGNKRFAEIGFGLNTLDDLLVPRSGVHIDLRFGLTRKSVAIDSIGAFSQQYLRLAGQWYRDLGQQQVLASNTQFYLLNASRITDSDLIRFGGANSLRGYAEEQFTASLTIWSDLEYRYMTSRDSYLFMFAAAGYYERPRLITESDNQFNNSGLLQSAGFGISYRIRIGRLNFTYALSPQESIANGKVHLGIVTEL